MKSILDGLKECRKEVTFDKKHAFQAPGGGGCAIGRAALRYFGRLGDVLGIHLGFLGEACSGLYNCQNPLGSATQLTEKNHYVSQF